MRKKIVGLIIKKFINYKQEDLEIIRYGLESLYIFISKTFFIFLLAYIFKTVKETIIFSLLYGLIRAPSFGLHATKSIYCFLSSTIIFIVIPYLLTLFDIAFIFRLILSILSLIIFIKRAPADTKEKPIINKKRRLIYKITSVTIAFLLIIASLFIKNVFLHNALVISLLIQSLLISKTVYKIFKLPYDNYKRWKGGDFCA